MTKTYPIRSSKSLQTNIVLPVYIPKRKKSSECQTTVRTKGCDQLSRLISDDAQELTVLTVTSAGATHESLLLGNFMALPEPNLWFSVSDI